MPVGCPPYYQQKQRTLRAVVDALMADRASFAAAFAIRLWFVMEAKAAL